MDTQLTIVVCAHRWLIVGEVWCDGARAGFERGAVIEYWGTEKGVGELQHEGPRDKTRLRKEGPSEWSVLGSEVRRLKIVDPKIALLWREALSALWDEP